MPSQETPIPAAELSVGEVRYDYGRQCWVVFLCPMDGGEPDVGFWSVERCSHPEPSRVCYACEHAGEVLLGWADEGMAWNDAEQGG